MKTLEIPYELTVGIADGGGRGHAYANACRRSRLAKKIFGFKGGDGWSEGPEDKIVQCFSNIDAADVDKIIVESLNQRVQLLIAGQEIFLANGGADKARDAGMKVLGCSRAAARLESSKVWAKWFFAKYGIPTANFETANSPEEATAIVDYWFLIKKVAALVVKADGLAEGKGVISCFSLAEARAAIRETMVDGTVKKTYPEAGKKVVIEEWIGGPGTREMSSTYFSDGDDLVEMIVGVDHKRRFAEDGKVDEKDNRNTGGMGLYAPDPEYTDDIRRQVRRIAKKIIAGMQKEACPFQGILYLGLMIRNGKVYVLEVNVRFGAPEAQGILALLESDFLELAWAAATGQLALVKPKWKKGKVSVTVTLVTGVYPSPITAEYKGFEITGIEEARALGVEILHAGTKLKDGKFVNNGGRVIDIVAVADTFREAIDLANKAAELIYWQDRDYRKDIGRRALAFAA